MGGSGTTWKLCGFPTAVTASPTEGTTPDEKIQKEVTDLNQRLSPWRYQLGSFEYTGLHKTMADLVDEATCERIATEAGRVLHWRVGSDPALGELVADRFGEGE